jgi:hypothetical protein
MTLTGPDTVANYQAALRAVSYNNTSDTPATLARTVTWIASDGAASSGAVTSTINVAAVNDAPTDIALSNSTVQENQASGTAAGPSPRRMQTSEIPLPTPWLRRRQHEQRFVPDRRKPAPDRGLLDFETTPSLSIRVRSTDAGGLFFEEAFTITVTNVNETPTDIALSNASSRENQAVTPLSETSRRPTGRGRYLHVHVVAGRRQHGQWLVQHQHQSTSHQRISTSRSRTVTASAFGAPTLAACSSRRSSRSP